MRSLIPHRSRLAAPLSPWSQWRARALLRLRPGFYVMRLRPGFYVMRLRRGAPPRGCRLSSTSSVDDVAAADRHPRTGS
jgi:hypothetical protein